MGCGLRHPPGGGLGELGGIELWVVWPQTEALMSRCSWTWRQVAARIYLFQKEGDRSPRKARLTTLGCTATPLSCGH